MAANGSKGILFTDGEYLSKDQISAHYNLADVDAIWDEVTAYRTYFRLALPLRDDDGLAYSLVLTRPLAARLFRLERRLAGLLARVSRLEDEDKAYLTGLAETAELSSVSRYYNLGLSDYDLTEVRLETKNSDARLAVLFNYEICQRGLSRRFLATLDTCFADWINASLQGLDKDAAEKPVCKAALAPLISFLAEEDDLPLFAKAIAALFWFRKSKPYDYLCAETAALLFKGYLAHEGFYAVPFLLAIEPMAYAASSSVITAENLAVKTRDLTYFVFAMLPFVEERMDEAGEWMAKAEARSLERETKQKALLDETAAALKATPGNGSVAQPGSPACQTIAAALERAVSDLLESYPVLHRNQARFYLTHRTIGRFYTVEQFRDTEEVAYETARKGMEFLAKLGFYDKSKTGKKFTYSPVPRNLGEESE